MINNKDLLKIKIIMAHKEIIFKKRRLTIHKANISPDISQPSVLVRDSWDFVDLWLQRNNQKQSSARFYWQQAKNFYDASLNLPKTAAPLTLYYCYLNAVKALLESKQKIYQPWHGVSGEFSSEGQVTLENEFIKLQNNGVLPALAQYLNQPIQNSPSANISLAKCLYNLPFLHRTFLLTYQGANYPELFIPIHSPLVVKSVTNSEAWFCAKVDDKYKDTRTLKAMLPGNYEIESKNGECIIRCKKSPCRIRWKHKTKPSDKIRIFIKYNNDLRKQLFYIHGVSISWYLKRDKIKSVNGKNINIIHHTTWHPLILIFSAMHRLSELARYDPQRLAEHFKYRQNWLLNEFIKVSPIQFIDEISSEITGLEFKIPKNII